MQVYLESENKRSISIKDSCCIWEWKNANWSLERQQTKMKSSTKRFWQHSKRNILVYLFLSCSCTIPRRDSDSPQLKKAARRTTSRRVFLRCTSTWEDTMSRQHQMAYIISSKTMSTHCTVKEKSKSKKSRNVIPHHQLARLHSELIFLLTLPLLSS